MTTTNKDKGVTFKTSKERMVMSYRQGNHATVYDIIRDPSLKNKVLCSIIIIINIIISLILSL